MHMLAEVEGFTGEIFHNGAFVAIHPDNSCEINLMDSFEKSELKPEQLGAWEVEDDQDDKGLKFVKLIRAKAKSFYSKKLV